MKLDLSERSIKECLKLAVERGENVLTNQHQRVIGKTTALIEFAIEHKYIVVVNNEAIANGLRFEFNYDHIVGIDRIHALKIIDGRNKEIVFDECCSPERIDQLVNLGFKVVTGFINEKNGKRREYYNASQCLACGYKDKIYHQSKEEYQEITVCPKCSGAFVDMFKIGKYKQFNKITNHKDNTHESIIEHIKEIDESVNRLKSADSFCSLMQAKSTALLALSLTPPYQK
ncbi:hypothetical protein COM06_17740 [Bacillus toyonensis]|uniref:hypothetical protein n=1 Tax=Bacillus toyonensis TaxID=155322 RepID=UPI000BF9CE1E|nr:hypothetical protein [Bacillus toyonensis]PGB25387.1 hypothetical protein COM06_17740 [Bacillus toyonensis]